MMYEAKLTANLENEKWYDPNDFPDFEFGILSPSTGSHTNSLIFKGKTVLYFLDVNFSFDKFRKVSWFTTSKIRLLKPSEQLTITGK